ncbi:MAG: hypothetical protein HeimC3_07160 [Candidatus Heimdallarchaeota archaeon LC_3]|nr:MAG: hypothetical protein HeimC3_07160 [Candidatus Heimdallarchaeota archaeon LC_3]
MKHFKLTLTIFGALFIVGLLGLNMYSSTSLPGFSGGKGCYACHNNPVYVYDYGTNNLPTWNATAEWPDTSAFGANGNFATNYVPVIPATDGSDIHTQLGFVKLIFASNDSHISLLVRIDFDPFINTSDKFAIVFNIDSTNFSIGQFKDGGMKMQNGNADMWLWKGTDVVPNGTGMADDRYVDTTADSDDDISSDVHVAVSYGGVGYGGTMGYYLQFTRARVTTDTAQDVQFGDGAHIPYGIAYWNGTSSINHHSSFDRSLVMGPSIEQIVTLNPYVTVTQTQEHTVTETQTILDEDTVTITTGNASAFTAILVIATIIAIPVIFKMRRK